MTGTSADGSRPVHLTALGVPVLLRCRGSRSAAVRDAVVTAWSRCLSPEAAEPVVRLDVVVDDDPAAVAEAGGDGVVAGSSVEQVMDALSPAVTMAAITEQAGRLVMLHAGAVAHPVTGRAVTLVGPSGRGKTTACRTLATTGGLGYLTDETVGVRDDGALVPYPKPLSVIVPGRPYKQQLLPDGLHVAPADCRLVGLLLLDRDPDAPAEPELQPLATVAALTALAPETSYLAEVPRPLHRLADVVAGAGGAHVVRYRDAADLLPVVRAMVGAS